jgi:hypothetical protein
MYQIKESDYTLYKRRNGEHIMQENQMLTKIRKRIVKKMPAVLSFMFVAVMFGVIIGMLGHYI